jgi:AcrR family transcriptional regulator
MPASPARRAQQREAKREAILNASFELFRTRGLAGTTVEEITRSAGVAKGTFYLYFDTREDLIAQLRVEFAGQIETFFAAATEPRDATAWPDFIARLTGGAVDQLVDQGDLIELIKGITRSDQAGPVAEAMARAHRRATSILEEGNRLGALDVPDPGTAAWLLFDLVQAAGERGATDAANARRYRQTAIDAAQRWLLKG